MMSATVIKFLPKRESTFCSGPHKKFRRKRHRNKCQNSSLKKKRLKRFHSTKSTAPYKSNILNTSPFSEEIMSNWYWSNYKKAVDWQNKQKVVHWKACALALLEENHYLLHIINNMKPGMVPDVPFTQNLDFRVNYNERNVKSTSSETFANFCTPDYNYENTNLDEDDDSSDGNDENEKFSDDIEFEMSEEMMEFFTQSYKNKIDLKKVKEEALLDNTDQEVKEIQNNKIKRSTEMSFLYGEGASMITGMETAVQLTFDKYCDTKSPKYWPNIPFKL